MRPTNTCSDTLGNEVRGARAIMAPKQPEEELPVVEPHQGDDTAQVTLAVLRPKAPMEARASLFANEFPPVSAAFSRETPSAAPTETASFAAWRPIISATVPGRLSVSLDHVGLGQVDLHLRLLGGNLQCSIAAEKPPTAALLAESREDLLVSMRAAGYVVDELTIQAVRKPPSDVAHPRLASSGASDPGQGAKGVTTTGAAAMTSAAAPRRGRAR